MVGATRVRDAVGAGVALFAGSALSATKTPAAGAPVARLAPAADVRNENARRFGSDAGYV
jgi:hypothetical protein